MMATDDHVSFALSGPRQYKVERLTIALIINVTHSPPIQDCTPYHTHAIATDRQHQKSGNSHIWIANLHD